MDWREGSHEYDAINGDQSDGLSNHG